MTAVASFMFPHTHSKCELTLRCGSVSPKSPAQAFSVAETCNIEVQDLLFYEAACKFSSANGPLLTDAVCDRLRNPTTRVRRRRYTQDRLRACSSGDTDRNIDQTCLLFRPLCLHPSPSPRLRAALPMPWMAQLQTVPSTLSSGSTGIATKGARRMRFSSRRRYARTSFRCRWTTS